MLEYYYSSDGDPDDEAELSARLSELIQKALDYPDVVGSPNDRFSVVKRTPLWVRNDEELILAYVSPESDISSEQVATKPVAAPNLEIEVSMDVLARDLATEQVATRDAVSIIDLTGTKVGTRFPVIEEIAFDPNEGVTYTAGYQWEEIVEGKSSIETTYRKLDPDVSVLQRFVAVLDRAYTTPRELTYPYDDAIPEFSQEQFKQFSNHFDLGKN